MVYHLADRAHNSCRTADAAFCKIRKLRQFNRTLFHLHAQDILCNDCDGTTCYRRKDAVRLGNDKSSFFVDEDKVCAAGLLYIGAGCGIKEHVFIVAVLMCGYIGMQTHRIVQTSLDMSGSMRCCAVKITDTDGKRMNAALKVRSNRSYQNAELIFIRGLNADNRRACKHIRTNI